MPTWSFKRCGAFGTAKPVTFCILGERLIGGWGVGGGGWGMKWGDLNCRTDFEISVNLCSIGKKTSGV